MPQSKKTRKGKKNKKQQVATNTGVSAPNGAMHPQTQPVQQKRFNSTLKYVPNMRTKQNANWEKRS